MQRSFLEFRWDFIAINNRFKGTTCTSISFPFNCIIKRKTIKHANGVYATRRVTWRGIEKLPADIPLRKALNRKLFYQFYLICPLLVDTHKSNPQMKIWSQFDPKSLVLAGFACNHSSHLYIDFIWIFGIHCCMEFHFHSLNLSWQYRSKHVLGSNWPQILLDVSSCIYSWGLMSLYLHVGHNCWFPGCVW